MFLQHTISMLNIFITETWIIDELFFYHCQFCMLTLQSLKKKAILSINANIFYVIFLQIIADFKLVHGFIKGHIFHKSLIFIKKYILQALPFKSDFLKTPHTRYINLQDNKFHFWWGLEISTRKKLFLVSFNMSNDAI